jgi:CRP-like cAMP-binding protein
LIELLEAEEQGTKARPNRPRSLIETLRDIWLENDPWLQACVMHLVGLFNLSKLRPLVEQTLMREADSNPLMHETALETQQRLDYPRDDEMLERLMLEKDMQTLGTLSTMSRILFLQKVNIFSSLSPEDLRRVALVSKERLFSPGEIICYEGDPGDELYIIVSGKVQIIAGYGGANTSGQGGGSGKTLRIASEGEAIGEMAILEDIPRSATLRAYNSPVRLLTLGEQEFKRIMRERPELAIELIRMLSRWLRETNRRVQDAPSRPEPTPATAIG